MVQSAPHHLCVLLEYLMLQLGAFVEERECGRPCILKLPAIIQEVLLVISKSLDLFLRKPSLSAVGGHALAEFIRKRWVFVQQLPGYHTNLNSGVIHVGERIKLSIRETTALCQTKINTSVLHRRLLGCMLGTIWIAEEPAPMTAAVLPWKSYSASHRAECNTGPVN